MIRRSVRVLLLALAVLLALSSTVSANHDAPHGGGGCTDQGSITGCYGGGGGGCIFYVDAPARTTVVVARSSRLGARTVPGPGTLLE